jgi:hypothetical protein
MFDFQQSFLVGRATGDWSRLRTKRDNICYTSFRVYVKNQAGQSVTVPVLAFGDLGDKVAAGIEKDLPVLVIGRVSINRRGQAAMVADQLRLGEPFKQKD